MNSDILDLTMGAIFWLVLTYGAAWVSARYMPDAWYRNLNKPAWNPPDAVFGVVWSGLYFLMAAAAWLVWRDTGWEGISGPLGLYLVQLGLNAAWPWLFFSRHRPGAALADMTVLWIAAAATMVSFWHVMPFAGKLFIPYLAWLSFAAALNFRIWRANPRRLR